MVCHNIASAATLYSAESTLVSIRLMFPVEILSSRDLTTLSRVFFARDWINASIVLTKDHLNVTNVLVNT
jgi:hypothetical protein